MNKKDINIYTAYKDGPSKPTESGYKSLLAVALVFIFIVAAVYGALVFIRTSTQSKIDKISAELMSPQVEETNAKLARQLRKNQLLLEYNKALDTARKNFDSTIFIDSALIAGIEAATPAGTTLQSMTFDSQGMEFSYTSNNKMSAAVIIQGLNKKNIFSSVSCDSISKDSGNDFESYAFTLNCTFKEVSAK